ncbi:MAG: hypothetical protein MUP81_05985 [Dehalococcoidia bacterium]|nr:hypothetical protein [Dehalococcoidia bacterium]
MKKLCRWSMYVVAGVLIVALLALIPIDERGIAKVGLLVTVALVAVTVTYATYAHVQAEASKKMAEEMMQQRYGGVFPIVDIKEQKESGSEMIKKGLDIGDGKIPEGQLCKLRNIGLGPAINVCSFIRTPTGERRQWDFGTLAVSDETDKERLSIELRDRRGILIAYCKDVYERPFESSREFIVNKKGRSCEIGPLKIRKLTEEEYIDSIRS